MGLWRLGHQLEERRVVCAHDDHQIRQIRHVELLQELQALCQKGRMVFFTTNHYERLSPEFLRPGRCDVKEKFGPATREQIVKLYDIFYTTNQEPSEPVDSKPVLLHGSDNLNSFLIKATDMQATLPNETLPKEASTNAHRFADLAENHGLAVAAFQTHFTKHDAESAITCWQDMLQAFETSL